MAKTNSGLLEFKDAQKVLIALDDATSEVKKAVVIDADGVETDIKGVQPTGKKEITSTAEVNVADYATAQVVDEDLVAGNIKKDVDILGVVGSYEGGGGSSDFSTAEVEVINTTADLVSVSAVSIRDTPSSAIVSFGTIMADSDRTHTVPLYKGVCSWKITAADAVVTVTGDISYDNGNIFITGDGTITISAA